MTLPRTRFRLPRGAAMRVVVRVLAVLALLVAGLVGVGGAAHAGGPQARWSYCNPPAGGADSLNGYDNQGYCGWNFQTPWYPETLNTCLHLPAGVDNTWGSVWNNTSRTVTIYESPSCTGVPGAVGSRWLQMSAHTSHPNLYAVGGVGDMGNRISAYIVF